MSTCTPGKTFSKVSSPLNFLNKTTVKLTLEKKITSRISAGQLSFGKIPAKNAPVDVLEALEEQEATMLASIAGVGMGRQEVAGVEGDMGLLRPFILTAAPTAVDDTPVLRYDRCVLQCVLQCVAVCVAECAAVCCSALQAAFHVLRSAEISKETSFI